jgi:hypothetical protein
MVTLLNYYGGRYWHDCMEAGFQLPVQSVAITTKVVSLIPAHREVYLIPHYVI